MFRLYFMIMEISRKLSKDNISGYAAQSCFYIVLSFFPSLLLIMSLIQFIPVTADYMIKVINEIAPMQLSSVLSNIITDLYTNTTVTFTFISAIATLWAAGKGFMAIIKGFDVIYEVNKKRNWFVQRLLSTIYTLLFIIIILATLLLLVFGNQLVELSSSVAPRFSTFLAAVMDSRAILFPGGLLLLFLFMFKFIPNRKSSIAKEFPGALIAALVWYLFSYFYSIYVNYSPNFSIMYGSLTTLIFALVWLYFCMIILFFGAEFNTFITKKYFTPLYKVSYLSRYQKYKKNKEKAKKDDKKEKEETNS